MSEVGKTIALIRALGTPTDAQVSSAVEGWLDDHPEATTTVQDGAITNAKLATSFVTPGTATAYSSSSTYAVGDYVFYNGALYRCISAISTAEAWTAAHWAAAVLGDDVGDLKSAIANDENRLTALDGNIVIPGLELGTVYVNNGSIAYANSSTNLRTPENVYVNLKNGDKIVSADSSTYKFLLSYTTDDITWVSSGWTADTYTVPSNAKYCLCLSTKANSTINDTVKANILANFSLYRYGSSAEKTSGTFTIVNNLIEVKCTLSNGYLDSAGGTVSQTADKEKYTQQIKTFSGMKTHIDLTYTNSSHSMWVAVGEWKNDGTFARTSLYAGTAWEYKADYTPASNVVSFSIMFRGFDDYTFALSLISDNYSIFKANDQNIDAAKSRVTYNFDQHRTKGINHRGYSSTAPENTIPAYQLSVENGFSFVETDVRFTSDNVPVLLHDDTVNRTSNGTGAIASMTYSQARALDFGSWKSSDYSGTQIPSFDEFIKFCRDTHIYPYIEISGAEYTATQIQSLINIVNYYGMERSVTWISFYLSNLKKVVAIDDKARVGLLPNGDMTETIATNAAALRTNKNEVFIDIDMQYADSDTVTICNTYKYPLEAWTVNSSDTMLSLPAYISGVTSDSVNFETVLRENALG